MTFSYPTDWEITTIGDFFDVYAGGDWDKDNSHKERSDTYKYPVFANAHVGQGIYGYANYWKANENTITVTGRGDVGLATYRTEKYVPIVRLITLDPKDGKECKFFSYFINNRIEIQSESTGVPQLTAVQISKYLIPVPKLNERISIAKALTDIDELIETLVKEENKHRYIKEGLLGQIDDRFSETTLLKDCVASPVTDGPHLTPIFYSSGVPFLSVNNIVDNKIVWENLRYISESDDLEFSRKCKPKKFDILLGKAASVGKVAIVDSDTDFNVWSPLAVIRMNEKYDPYFVYFCFQTKTVMNQITFLTNSSSQGNIGMGDIENIHIPMIEKSEQIRLGNLLKDEDNQIEGISKLRHKYECIKQGMAHDLLTGKVRLV